VREPVLALLVLVQELAVVKALSSQQAVAQAPVPALEPEEPDARVVEHCFLSCCQKISY
jgi:hypothetical protein